MTMTMTLSDMRAGLLVENYSWLSPITMIIPKTSNCLVDGKGLGGYLLLGIYHTDLYRRALLPLAFRKTDEPSYS